MSFYIPKRANSAPLTLRDYLRFLVGGAAILFACVWLAFFLKFGVQGVAGRLGGSTVTVPAGKAELALSYPGHLASQADLVSHSFGSLPRGGQLLVLLAGGVADETLDALKTVYKSSGPTLLILVRPVDATRVSSALSGVGADVRVVCGSPDAGSVFVSTSDVVVLGDSDAAVALQGTDVSQRVREMWFHFWSSAFGGAGCRQ